jgi:hypothetical protein
MALGIPVISFLFSWSVVTQEIFGLLGMMAQYLNSRLYDNMKVVNSIWIVHCGLVLRRIVLLTSD